MKANKKGVPFIIIGILLIVSAIVLTGYNDIANYRAGKIAQDVVEQLEVKISNDDDYGINKNMEMPIVKVNGYEFVGIIEIPSLDLKLPVMDSWSYKNLNVSPCRYSGTVYNSNMVIAGHNYNTHFGKLRHLNKGDTVKFTDTDGNVFIYEVKDLEVLPPTSVEEMKNSDWDLTLFTCTIGAKTRLAIRCSLSSTTTTQTSQNDYLI